MIPECGISSRSLSRGIRPSMPLLTDLQRDSFENPRGNDVISLDSYLCGPLESSSSSAEFQRLRRSNARKWFLRMAAIMVVITGTFNSIVTKLMNKQDLPPSPGYKAQNFQGPWWQSFLMYLGETICLLLFYLDRYFFVTHSKIAPKEGTFDFRTSAEFCSTKPKCPFYWWFVPTVADLLATTLFNYATVYTLASTVQMITNFNVVVTAIFSLFIIRLALRTYQWVGVTVITLGLMVTSVFSLQHPEEDVNTKRASYVGLTCALMGIMFNAFQFVFEERLFRKYYCSPMEGVGIQGVMGLGVSMIILTAGELQGFERTSETLYMLKQSTTLTIAMVSFIVSVAFFNVAGLVCSKLGSGLLRIVIIGTRSLTIWIVELTIRWNDFDIMQFMALLILLAGTLMFNGFPIADNETTFGIIWNKPLMCLKFLRNPNEPVVQQNMIEVAMEESTPEMRMDRNYTAVQDTLDISRG